MFKVRSISDSPGSSLDLEEGVRRPIRVGFVMHEMQVAGAEKLVESLILQLADRISPTIFCLDRIGSLGEQMQEDGIEVYSLDRQPGLDLGVAWRLARRLRKQRVEVVHAHQYTPFFYSALARLQSVSGFRIMFTEHGRHYPDVVSSRRRWGNRVLLGRLANEINACSEFSGRALVEVDGFNSQRLSIVRNGIDLSRYAARDSRHRICQRLGIAPERHYVSAIARFHPVKDHATLLRAFAELVKRRADTDLLLAGDGPQRQEMERLSHHLEIDSRVHFLGMQPEVQPVLQISDVFCLTSLSEAASLTILEAMASGIPVVATDVGGNPEMIENGVEGLLVPRGDPSAVASAMTMILEDRSLRERMAKAGPERVRKEFQLERTVENYWQLYKRLARVERAAEQPRREVH